MLKNDLWIKKMSIENKMIEPFEAGQISDGAISFGTSSYGYDMRVADEFLTMKKDISNIDPKNTISAFDGKRVDGFIIIEPRQTILGKSVEYFKIPRDILAITFGKSTYARCGILINVTPLEPEWEGFITISISNISSMPVKVYANEGIAQVLFLQSDEPCGISYSDRKGKYQKQKDITSAKI
ncbi:MAG: dCTP deaminase [Elusimicrobiota bacterium]|jgi:dCTP deaminase|nr:dCTP deaminase [Elusimicrobiota bacterium]